MIVYRRYGDFSMEKIYEEENNQRQNRSVVDFSVVLSFVVSIFAIFSIATFGIASNQGGSISYAAPMDEMPENFNFSLGSENGSVLRIATTGGVGTFWVPIYVANDSMTLPILCVEHNSNTVDDAHYVRDEEITDPGLLYILDKTFMNGNKVSDASGNDAQYVETWIAQVAVWMYLYEQNSAETRNYLSPEDIQAIKTANTLTLYIGGSDTRTIYTTPGGTVYDKYVASLVNNAKSYSLVKSLDIQKGTEEVSKTSDGKYYQSATMTVVPSGNMSSYDVSFGGVDGAFAVDLDGNKIGPNNIPAGTKFRVWVPVDNVKESLSKLRISVTGHFNTLKGFYYVGKDDNGNRLVDSEGAFLQKVGSVEEGVKDITVGEEYELLGSPNTGMNTAQTIYFIGLIILLCGVGIIYANAKPVESKQ